MITNGSACTAVRVSLPHTKYDAASTVNRANWSDLDYTMLLRDKRVRTHQPGITHPTGPVPAITSLSHILPVGILALDDCRDPDGCQGSAGEAESPADRMWLAMTVSEAGGGGEKTVIEFQKQATQGRTTRGSEHAFVFPDLRRLQLDHSILKRSPQSGPRNSSGPFFFSVGVRGRRPRRGHEVDVQREAGASFS
ncbi:hypothetical protein [Streptomyces sp. NBC_00893]|uniref:hypothetical protein n=1 Tax=Streptomyces sp. NBC_00893 TaxID=2975862 RepID=UPI00224F9569|nr:hypothetical protein [Streptomyces sp. NBC_00893]MCX4850927.1 hypothetical protein [Streptomyces sp. NBC_00893]